MNIYGSPLLHGSHAISGPHTTKPQQTSAPQQAASPHVKDKITLSSAAQQANQATESTTSNGEIRFDLVNRIRMEITAGTYETPEKLDAALEKMLVGIGG
ncbi:MAG: flagellar biosynthesis anti-sigma factor FlgM [Planctomycetaceae bacterium]|nr:flagellar biosynthesis anti-sigma factor FlgM [Planctomycetaceae bacterium]